MKNAKARVWLIVGLIVLTILGLAWFDGGEQSIRPITQNVSVPEGR